MAELTDPQKIVILRDALIAAKSEHFICDEDCWYSCAVAKNKDGSPACCDTEAVAKGKCTCGADSRNANIEAVIARIDGFTF